MATPGFGFSVGDVLAGLHVVQKLVRALNDAAGARAAYRRLIAGLLDLEEALAGVDRLQRQRGAGGDPAQKMALGRVADQCRVRIQTFLDKHAKFQDSLGVGAPGPSSSSLQLLRAASWRTNWHKIQWALCKDEPIDELRTELAAHTTTLNLILSTIQL